MPEKLDLCRLRRHRLRWRITLFSVLMCFLAIPDAPESSATQFTLSLAQLTALEPAIWDVDIHPGPSSNTCEPEDEMTGSQDGGAGVEIPEGCERFELTDDGIYPGFYYHVDLHEIEGQRESVDVFAALIDYDTGNPVNVEIRRQRINGAWPRGKLWKHHEPARKVRSSKIVHPWRKVVPLEGNYYVLRVAFEDGAGWHVITTIPFQLEDER